MGCRRAEDVSVRALLRLAATGSTAAATRPRLGDSIRRAALPLDDPASVAGRRVRTYATTAEDARIAVIGGGLTGLTAAYYLAKQVPRTTKIVLYEASDRLGGWIKTDWVKVKMWGDELELKFERGPRTLSSLRKSLGRFDDLVLYDLALDLGLQLSAPPDRPRYILYGGRPVLLPPDAPLGRFVREPLFLDTVGAVAGAVLRRLVRSDMPAEDLSVSDWLRKIWMGPAVADNLVSAMVHGIYGGDIDKLSARSVLGRMYTSYYQAMGKPKPGFVSLTRREHDLLAAMSRDPLIRERAQLPKGQLLHFGPLGMETLPTMLADALGKQPNVELRTSSKVGAISFHPRQHKVSLLATGGKDGSGSDESYDRVISTTDSKQLCTPSRS
ncbi:hypothetical protein CDD83_10273 [Cordyceps sp. RAO-2017]|nr:hypothetical protein CDD83_10273 [Cordyceps sp. RAO-2017]